MNTKDEVHSSTANLDMLRWVFVSFILSAAIYGYHHYEAYPIAYRLLAILPIAAIAAFVLLGTKQGYAFWQLTREAVAEAKRVVWPTRQETTQTTLIVLAVICLAGLLLWLLDVLLNWLTSVIMA